MSIRSRLMCAVLAVVFVCLAVIAFFRPNIGGIEIGDVDNIALYDYRNGGEKVLTEKSQIKMACSILSKAVKWQEPYCLPSPHILSGYGDFYVIVTSSTGEEAAMVLDGEVLCVLDTQGEPHCYRVGVTLKTKLWSLQEESQWVQPTKFARDTMKSLKDAFCTGQALIPPTVEMIKAFPAMVRTAAKILLAVLVCSLLLMWLYAKLPGMWKKMLCPAICCAVFALALAGVWSASGLLPFSAAQVDKVVMYQNPSHSGTTKTARSLSDGEDIVELYRLLNSAPEQWLPDIEMLPETSGELAIAFHLKNGDVKLYCLLLDYNEPAEAFALCDMSGWQWNYTIENGTGITEFWERAHGEEELTDPYESIYTERWENYDSRRALTGEDALQAELKIIGRGAVLLPGICLALSLLWLWRNVRKYKT